MVIDSIDSLSPAKYLSLARALQTSPLDGTALRVALLSSNSFSFLEPYLVVECARRQLAVTPWVAPFAQIEQSILSTNGGIEEFSADVVVIALRIEDAFPDAYFSAPGPRFSESVDECVTRLESCVKQVRQRSDATLLVANFAMPSSAAHGGFFDSSNPNGPIHVVSEANRRLASFLSEISGAVVWDYQGLVSSRGADNWTDQRLVHLARQPIAGPNLPYAAAHLARSIAGTVYPPAKCLVLDLDNTLWGGVAGDDGVAGIQIGDDYPGNVFKAFQQAVIGLKRRGILLAIASKNDESVVKEIFDEHPDLLVRWEDFATTQINWDAKSANLKAIAEQLNIGIDSLTFFDDNPVEREEVRLNAPKVQVIDVPTSAVSYVDALFGSALFDAPNATAEDAQRAVLYQNESRRQQARQHVSSMEEFLVGLEMTASMGDVDKSSISRASQLVAKTNQFNLTTRRHSQSTLQRMSDSHTHDVRWTRVADRYGDSGIVGVTVVEYGDKTATIDSFIMSCRVMNREVERAMLCDVVERAVEKGCDTLIGVHVASDRNAISAGLYHDAGFTPSDSADGTSKFALNLGNPSEWPKASDVIEIG